MRALSSTSTGASDDDEDKLSIPLNNATEKPMNSNVAVSSQR